MREAPLETINLLYFGTIHSYKSPENLGRAFGLSDPSRFWLTVVGKTWGGRKLPAQLIAQTPHAARATLVNSYVTDEEAERGVAWLDALVALPYRRSSRGGPLHVAMAVGLPGGTTQVPPLIEAVFGYECDAFIAAQGVDAWNDALLARASVQGKRYEDPHSWEESVRCYERLIAELRAGAAGSPTRR